MPDWKKAIRERLKTAGLDPLSEADMVEEIAEHLENRYQELRTQGVCEEESQSHCLAELDDGDLLVKATRLIHRPPPARATVGISSHKTDWSAGWRMI